MAIQNNNLNAAALALLASLLLSFIDNFVLALSQESGLWQFQLVRSMIAVPLFLVWASFSKVSLKPEVLGKTVLRSLIVSTGLLTYFAALGFLPVAQAGAGLFSSPLWVLVFSALIFRTKVTVLQMLAMSLGFAGVVVLLQLDLANLDLVSVTPLAAGAFYGLGMLVTRHWCREESPLTLAMGVFLTMGIVSAVFLAYFTAFPVTGAETVFALRGWTPPTIAFWWLTLLQAVGSVIAVSAISQAYRIGEPSFVAVFEYSFLVFAALWAFALWGQAITSPAILGIIAILASGTTISYLAHRAVKRYQKRPI